MTGTIIFILSLVLIFGAYMAWFYSRSRAMLHEWAVANGYEIIDAELRNFRRGPLLWSSSRYQAVFFVRVRDREGRERAGWLSCGSYWAGVFSDQTEVRWE